MTFTEVLKRGQSGAFTHAAPKRVTEPESPSAADSDACGRNGWVGSVSTRGVNRKAIKQTTDTLEHPGLKRILPKRQIFREQKHMENSQPHATTQQHEIPTQQKYRPKEGKCVSFVHSMANSGTVNSYVLHSSPRCRHLVARRLLGALLALLGTRRYYSNKGHRYERRDRTLLVAICY